MKAMSCELRGARRERIGFKPKRRGLVQFSANHVNAEGNGRAISTQLAPRNSRLAPHSAVTLVELLVTMVILVILGTAILGASRVAMEGARAARTKTTITKLHALLMEQYESYQTRRVEVYPEIVKLIENRFPPGPNRGRALADMRLLALRELMKFEMPDRWSDADMTSYPLFNDRPAAFLERPPAIAQTYHRKYLQAVSVSGGDTEKVQTNSSAECLYLTIMLLTGEGEARTHFSQQDIGDTDGDGAPEFLDGWGNAIRWVRWPAGFVDRSFLMTGDSDADHDPFDPFRRNVANIRPPASSFPNKIDRYITHLRRTDHPSGFRLVPLIFSMGSDGIGDISTRTQNINDPNGTVLLDPYAWDDNYGAYEFGSYGDNPAASNGEDNSIDNIHNHLMDSK